MTRKNVNRIPIDYPGSKAKILSDVMLYFGNECQNVIEPCGGTGAFILTHPQKTDAGKPIRRIYNDYDEMLANALRAIQYGKAEVLAEICSQYYSEIDLLAWNYELANRRQDLREKLINDPKCFNLESAGKYIWGMRGWIGSDFSNPKKNPKKKVPNASNRGWTNGSALKTILKLKQSTTGLQTFCGDYEDILKSSTQLNTKRNKKISAVVFFDSVYPQWICSPQYVYNDPLLCLRTRETALKLGNFLDIRVGWCGYFSYHDQFFPDNWQRLRWKADGGRGNQAISGRGRINATDECVWFSPGCLKPHHSEIS